MLITTSLTEKDFKEDVTQKRLAAQSSLARSRGDTSVQGRDRISSSNSVSSTDGGGTTRNRRTGLAMAPIKENDEKGSEEEGEEEVGSLPKFGDTTKPHSQQRSAVGSLIRMASQSISSFLGGADKSESKAVVESKAEQLAILKQKALTFQTRGNEQLAKGNPEGAIRWFALAIELDPTNANYCHQICKAAKQKPKLTSLIYKCHHNLIGEVRRIKDDLLKHPIDTVDLSNNSMPGSVFSEMLSAMMTCHTLQDLNVENNNLCDEGVMQISKLLQVKDSKLVSLNLRNNNIGERVMTAPLFLNDIFLVILSSFACLF